MASTPDFEKLCSIYSAIKDIDRIRNSNSEEKFDEILNVIKDIKKTEFDDENMEKIIDGIRDALLKIYKESLIKLNSGISLNSSFTNTDTFPFGGNLRGNVIDVPLSHPDTPLREDERVGKITDKTGPNSYNK